MGFSAMLRRTGRTLVHAPLRRTLASRPARRTLVCVPVLCALTSVPAAAVARMPRGGSGGAGIGGGSAGSPSPGSSTPAPALPAAPTTHSHRVVRLVGVINASGDGISLTVAASGTLGQPLTVSGTAPRSDAGALIALESARAGRNNWTQVASATIAANGSFSAQWTPSANGQIALRAVLGAGATGSSTSPSGAAGLSGSSGTGSAAAAGGQLSTSALTIPIFRNAIATVYGPGFWGHRTACGERLTRATLGVASRTLKCGTKVAVLYQGRELTVPVIDRGPFANGASWDLTMATARALGIRATVTIGTLTSAIPPAFSAHS